MVWLCHREGCTFSDTGVCARAAEFAEPETECDDYLSSQPEELPEPSLPDIPVFPPWTGNAIGSDFAEQMQLGNVPARVLIAGKPGSGKTTLLTGQFLELDRVVHSGLPAQFAGSYTLYGYDQLCDFAFRWSPGTPGAVPHTSRGQARAPAWLHLAFRYPGSGATRHILFSDMPGEIFNDWCGDSSVVSGDVLESVHVFWIVVDASLAAQKVERSAACDLVRRVKSASAGRPVEVILTKYDVLVDLSKPPEHGEILAPAAQLISELRQAWGPASELTITPLAAFPHESASNPGWQTLEPLRRLLAAQATNPVPAERVLRRYVDYVGLTQ